MAVASWSCFHSQPLSTYTPLMILLLVLIFLLLNRFNFFDLELQRGRCDGVCSEQSCMVVCGLYCLVFLMQENELQY